MLSGLWTHGKGRLHLPDQKDVFFLPQKPYMPLGSLRHQLLFPQSNQFKATDAKLEQLLEEVHLGHLLQRFGSFDAEIDWAQVRHFVPALNRSFIGRC